MIFLLACAEPFEHDASDLIGARIASVSIEDGIMVWSGEGLFHQTQPEIKWYNSSGIEIAQGYEIPQTDDTMQLLVLVNEIELWAEVALGNAAIDMQTESFVFDADLEHISIAEREKEETEDLEKWLQSNEELQENQSWRISLVDESNDSLHAHWFTPLEHGTAFPLSAKTVDIYPYDMYFDDGALIGSEAKEIIASLISVSNTQEAATSVRWKWMGVPRENTAMVQERWISSDLIVQKDQLYQATIVRSDDLWGVGLEDVVEIEDFEMNDLLDIQDDLLCLERSLLRFDWIVSGRCPLDEIVGAKVVILP